MRGDQVIRHSLSAHLGGRAGTASEPGVWRRREGGSLVQVAIRDERVCSRAALPTTTVINPRSVTVFCGILKQQVIIPPYVMNFRNEKPGAFFFSRGQGVFVGPICKTQNILTTSLYYPGRRKRSDQQLSENPYCG